MSGGAGFGGDVLDGFLDDREEGLQVAGGPFADRHVVAGDLHDAFHDLLVEVHWTLADLLSGGLVEDRFGQRVAAEDDPRRHGREVQCVERVCPADVDGVLHGFDLLDVADGQVVQEHLVAEFDQRDASERVRAGGVRQEHPSLDPRWQAVAFVVAARADAHDVENHVGQQQRAELVLLVVADQEAGVDLSGERVVVDGRGVGVFEADARPAVRHRGDQAERTSGRGHHQSRLLQFAVAVVALPHAHDMRVELTVVVWDKASEMDALDRCLRHRQAPVVSET